MNARQLAAYAQKYELNEIAARLLALEATIRPTIGFVGEFSAGKSMLINALLDQKLLPAMDRPTTGTIVEIEVDASATDMRFFRRDTSGTEPITILEFNDIATGNQAGIAVLVVPPRGVLKSGYRLVDTPGIESLNQAHEDLTRGFLPQLDGVVVCVDVNKGGLHESILAFMNRPEIRAIRDRFLFAICRADQKAPSGRANVFAEVRKSVEAWLDLPGLVPPAGDRVVLASAASVMGKTADVGIVDFERAFEAVFISHGDALRQARLRRDLPTVANELLGLLRDLAENYELEDVALKNKAKAIEAELRELDTQRSDLRNRVQQVGTELRKKLSGIADEFVPAFGRSTTESIDQVSHDYGEVLTQTVTAVASRYATTVRLPTFKYASARVSDRVNAILSGRELAVNVVTAVVLAAATGGTGAAAGGAAAGAAEGAAAGSAKAGAAVAAQAGAKAAAKEAAKAAARTAAGAVVKKAALSKAAEFALNAVGGAGKVIKQINPVEHVGTLIAGPIQKSSAESVIRSIHAQLATDVESTIVEAYEQEVLAPIEEQLKAKRRQLDAVLEERRTKLVEIADKRRGVEVDIERIGEAIVK